MFDRSWLPDVPASLVVVLALVVGAGGTVTLTQRGAPPAAAAAPTGVAAMAEAVATVRSEPAPPTPSPLPPPDAAAGHDPSLDEPSADVEPAPEPAPDPDPEAEPDPEPAAPADDGAATRPGDVEGRTADSPLPLLDRDELTATAARVGIPERALAAYASAALRLREERPTCNLTWVTLAGVGYVESHHGTIGGRQLRPDGTVSEPIIGIALDGGPNVRAIRDTDGGRYDGDATWDRAVGPMQFIPSTWARWGADGTGDGQADPQHIDDAALAAARYLCASGKDLTASTNWGQALWSYNRSEHYIRQVLAVANTYADRANAG